MKLCICMLPCLLQAPASSQWLDHMNANWVKLNGAISELLVWSFCVPFFFGFSWNTVIFLEPTRGNQSRSAIIVSVWPLIRPALPLRIFLHLISISNEIQMAIVIGSVVSASLPQVAGGEWFSAPWVGDRCGATAADKLAQRLDRPH